ncbi:MAG TPA: bifunctional phosphoribosylaminoimidazolecarboxamide formyltransferase/IMP cyclohydrolase, partial [Vicinamibacterales bacterium]|nr:bifunctional phosphoribosylaminoimidazolecarboxamide formyltransferase/IMP cyclohydrolase [Vicinamibacterales bacterium]
MPRALLTVSDKTGLVELAGGLRGRGYELVSTGGTAEALSRAGLPVKRVSEITGFPEIMDGRVKTLHPLIHGGILARRSDRAHLASAAEHGITLVDVVVVNLYPFVAAASNPATPFDALVEEIDIGGPSLVRAAAKNFEGVIVVVSPADYGEVLRQLDRPGGPSRAFRFELARKAFEHTASYDAAIASALGDVTVGETGFVRIAPGLPARMTIHLQKVRDLRYGENPHQQGALYAGFGPHPGYVLLQGKELSYTNLLDLDAAIQIVIQFREPAAALVKHTNPCGVATGSSAADAYVRAREADALSAFGAAVALNRPIDVETARAIVSTRIDAVIAPSVDDEARPILAAKASMRVAVPERVPADSEAPAAQDFELRSIVGGVLVQSRDVVWEGLEAWPSGDLTVVTKRRPTPDEWEALRFAWRVCAHVKSNTIVFT